MICPNSKRCWSRLCRNIPACEVLAECRLKGVRRVDEMIERLFMQSSSDCCDAQSLKVIFDCMGGFGLPARFCFPLKGDLGGGGNFWHSGRARVAE
jgi:hypothetical protein